MKKAPRKVQSLRIRGHKFIFVECPQCGMPHAIDADLRGVTCKCKTRLRLEAL
jgi:hypothetical protein